MLHLLNLLAAISLLVWGTHIVRAGVLRVFGENLRQVLAKSFRNRFSALLAGVGVTGTMTESPAVRALLVALPSEVALDIVVGAALTVMSYSSLAIVLLTATLAASGMVPSTVALGLVIGANLGSGLLAMIATGRASPQVRRLPVGNFLFKVGGAVIAIPLLPEAHVLLQEHVSTVHQQVVLFHLGFNLMLAMLFIGFTGPIARATDRLLPAPPVGAGTERPR